MSGCPASDWVWVNVQCCGNVWVICFRQRHALRAGCSLAPAWRIKQQPHKSLHNQGLPNTFRSTSLLLKQPRMGTSPDSPQRNLPTGPIKMHLYVCKQWPSLSRDCAVCSDNKDHVSMSTPPLLLPPRNFIWLHILQVTSCSSPQNYFPPFQVTMFTAVERKGGGGWRGGRVSHPELSFSPRVKCFSRLLQLL